MWLRLKVNGMPFWSAVIERLRLNPQVDLDRAAYLSSTINRTRYTWQIKLALCNALGLRSQPN